MIKPIPEQSEPTPEADAATAARRLRPAQAAPAQRDPRSDECIDECLGGSISPSQACVLSGSVLSMLRGCGLWTSGGAI